MGRSKIPTSLLSRIHLSKICCEKLRHFFPIETSTSLTSLTNLREERKGPFEPIVAKELTAQTRKLVENMQNGSVLKRDGLPNIGWNLVTTASGTLWHGDDMNITLRARSYSEINEIYDKDIKKTVIGNQDITSNCSYLEIKVSKDYNHNKKKKKITFKKRILLDNLLILKLLQSWESRYYINWIKKKEPSVNIPFYNFEDILSDIKETALDNPNNDSSSLDVLDIIKIIYDDDKLYSMDRISTYTRRALILEVFNSNFNEDGIKVEMTEDRNIQFYRPGSFMDFLGTGYLNPINYILFQPKKTVPYHFIEFKIPLIDKNALSENSLQLYNFIGQGLNKRVFNKNMGKINYAKHHIYKI